MKTLTTNLSVALFPSKQRYTDFFRQEKYGMLKNAFVGPIQRMDDASRINFIRMSERNYFKIFVFHMTTEVETIS